MISAFGVALTCGTYALLGRVLVSIFYDVGTVTNPSTLGVTNDNKPPVGYSAFQYDGLLRLKRVDFLADNCRNLVDTETRNNSEEPEIISLVCRL